MGFASFPELAAGDVLTLGLQLLAVWLVGLLAGWLLPKPKWVQRGLNAKALLLATPPGLWARRLVVAAHLTLITREVWRNLQPPGTFRGVLRNAWLAATRRQPFRWPVPGGAPAGAGALAPGASTAAADADDAGWYVGSADLAAFKAVLDGTDGGAAWEPMMHKQWPGTTYTAWRRTLPSGKSEYKSVTLSEDATAEEFMDFYLDDDARRGWDSMISETNLLESGGPSGGRGQVVRWLRTFPFAFVSQREYVLARRFWRDPADGALYACTKGVEHAGAPRLAGVVRMEDCYSHWRSRTVECPLGSGRPACETTLLHFEDFRIPERLARFAVRAGMAGFVKGMTPAVQAFVASRRARCDPAAEDPCAYCMRRALPAAPAPAPPLASQPSLAGSEGGYCASLSGSASASLDDSASERSLPGGGLKRSGSLKRLASMMVASGVAIALARSASAGSLPGPGAAGPGRAAGAGGSGGGGGHGRRHGHGHGQQQREGGARHHGYGHRPHRGHMPPRPRRRRDDDAPAPRPASPEPAAVAAALA